MILLKYLYIQQISYLLCAKCLSQVLRIPAQGDHIPTHNKSLEIATDRK